MNTEKNIFDKDRYRAIAECLEIYGNDNSEQGLRRLFLQHKLVRGCEKDYLKKYVTMSGAKERIMGYLNSAQENGLDKKYYEYGKNYIMNADIIPKEKPFKSKKSLDKALDELRMFKLIESVKPKKGYSYLVLTERGSILIHKWKLHDIVENMLNDRKSLLSVHMYAIDIVVKQWSYERKKE